MRVSSCGRVDVKVTGSKVKKLSCQERFFLQLLKSPRTLTGAVVRRVATNQELELQGKKKGNNQAVCNDLKKEWK